MEENKEYLKGDVLDFGCGTQPYKDLVNGTYTGFEKGDNWEDKEYDCIMCNQVMQYLTDPSDYLNTMNYHLKKGGYLVMTYPTHWEELEHLDFWRFTKAGMELLLRRNGFEIIKHQERCNIPFEDFKLAIGYGVIAKKH